MDVLKPLFGFRFNNDKIDLALEFDEWVLYDDFWAEEHHKSVHNLFYLIKMVEDKKDGKYRENVDIPTFVSLIAHKLSDNSVAKINHIKKESQTIEEFMLKNISKQNSGQLSTSLYAMVQSSVISEEDQKKMVEENALRMMESQ